MRIAAALLTGAIVGWLACQVWTVRRRHDRISDELGALRRLYEFDLSATTSPVSKATLSITTTDPATDDFTIEARTPEWKDRNPSMGGGW